MPVNALMLSHKPFSFYIMRNNTVNVNMVYACQFKSI